MNNNQNIFNPYFICKYFIFQICYSYIKLYIIYVIIFILLKYKVIFFFFNDFYHIISL